MDCSPFQSNGSKMSETTFSGSTSGKATVMQGYAIPLAEEDGPVRVPAPKRNNFQLDARDSGAPPPRPPKSGSAANGSVRSNGSTKSAGGASFNHGGFNIPIQEEPEEDIGFGSGAVNHGGFSIPVQGESIPLKDLGKKPNGGASRPSATIQGFSIPVEL